MSDNINPGIGTLIAISPNLPASPMGATEYGAVTGWETIGEVTEIGEYGPQHEVVSHTPLATGITAKYHGAKNMGSVTIQFARDATDDGQDEALDALTSRERCSFRITFADGSIDYVQGKVFSFTRGASMGAVVSGSMLVEFETETVPVPAGT